MSGHAALPDYGIQDPDAFIQEYRYNICHIVDVERAFPWFRHRKVIDQYDEESILGRHNTSFLRAGHLVDVLMRRGKSGLNALLEHLEYDYPEHFHTFTKRTPRACPDYYRPHYRPLSGMILDQLGNLTQQLVKTYVDQRENQKCMEVSLKTLESQITEFQQELERKEQQISELSQNNLYIREECKNYESLVTQQRREKQDVVEECNRLRKVKDKYEAKLNNIGDQQTSDRTSVRQKSVRDQNREKLNRELLEVRQELEKYKSSSKIMTKEDSTNMTIKEQKEQIKKLVMEREAVLAEKEDLCEELDRLQILTAQYEDKNAGLQNSYSIMQAERDRHLLMVEDLERKCETLTCTNSALMAEIHSRDTELRQIVSEANTYGYRPRLPGIGNERCPVSPERPAPSPKIKPVMPDFGAIIKNKKKDHYHEITPDEAGDRIPTVDSDQEEETVVPPLYPRGTRMSRTGAILRIPSTERDNSAVLLRTGKRRHPLVLFSPKAIHTDLEKCLLKKDTFKVCPSEKLHNEANLTAWLEGGTCIHYRQVDGYFDCIATQTLRDEMQREDGGRTLLSDVTPEAIQRMLNQRISPIVMVVKYKDLEQKDLKSTEEEALEQVHQDFHCQYEKIVISRGEEVEQVARMITIKCAATETSSRSGVYSGHSSTSSM